MVRGQDCCILQENLYFTVIRFFFFLPQGHRHLKSILRHKIAKHQHQKKVEVKTEDKEEEKPGQRNILT